MLLLTVHMVCNSTVFSVMFNFLSNSLLFCICFHLTSVALVLTVIFSFSSRILLRGFCNFFIRECPVSKIHLFGLFPSMQSATSLACNTSVHSRQTPTKNVQFLSVVALEFRSKSKTERNASCCSSASFFAQFRTHIIYLLVFFKQKRPYCLPCHCCCS